MNFVNIRSYAGIATLTLSRRKVNALNGAVVAQMHSALVALENDPEIKAIILTGQGKFFSFGFDVPEFLSYSREEFGEYLTQFTSLYRYMFLYPKPIVAALNGHTIAGGCMLALTCDFRVMVSEKAKISLNEIGFGSSVFAGSTEMLRFHAGNSNAAKVLYSGAMYSAQEAKEVGLVDEVATEENLIDLTTTLASDFGKKPARAFASIKSLLRKPVLEDINYREENSIREFLDIWYSDATWQNLKNIRIY